MNLFLCLLGPSLISIKIFYNLNSRELTNKFIAYYYFLFVFINNFICTIISVTILKGRTSIDESLINIPIFAIKYLIVSIIFSIFLPFLIQIIKENISYSVEVKENEKNKKDKKKTRKKSKSKSNK